VFDVWRAALTLIEHSDVTSCGETTHLRAGAKYNRVRVGLTATVFDDGGQATR